MDNFSKGRRFESGYQQNTERIGNINKIGMNKFHKHQILKLQSFEYCRDIDHPNEDLGLLYANDVKEIIAKMAKDGKKPSAFIAESLQSCGGYQFV